MGTEKRERQKANRALKQQQVESARSRQRLLRKAAIAIGAIAAIVLFVWIASTVVGSDEDENPPAPAPTTVAASTVPDATDG